MSVHCTAYALDRDFGNPTRKLIMIILADFADEAGESWPGIETISTKAGCSVRAAQEHLRALREAGEIRIAFNSGPYKTNRYRIVFSKKSPAACIPQIPHPAESAPPQNPAGKTSPHPAESRRESAPNPSGTIKEPSGRGEERGREAASPPPAPAEPQGGIALVALLRAFPSAPLPLVGADAVNFRAGLPLFATLAEEDWTALEAWQKAPTSIRGRKRWPRDLSEFLRHPGEALESARAWWKTDGRNWWHMRNRPKPAQSPPPTPPSEIDQPATPKEIAAFFAKAKK